MFVLMNGSLCECGVIYVVICVLQCPTERPGHLMSSLQLYRTLDLQTLELHAIPSHESRR